MQDPQYGSTHSRRAPQQRHAQGPRNPTDPGLPVAVCEGASTAFTRQLLDIPKSYVNDAACLDQLTYVANLQCTTTVLKRQRRHKHQSINCDANGSPYSKDFPGCGLPHPQQGYTTPPTRSIGPRRLRGISAHDIMHVNHHSSLAHTGAATLDLKARRIKLEGQGPGGKNIIASPTRPSSLHMPHAGLQHSAKPKTAGKRIPNNANATRAKGRRKHPAHEFRNPSTYLNNPTNKECPVRPNGSSS